MPDAPPPGYGAVTTNVVLALSPFLVVTTGFVFLSPVIAHHLGTSRTTIQVFDGLAIAGYAFGALLGGDIVQRFSQRTLFVICESGFVVGSLTAAVATEPIAFGAGHVLQGFATGLLLVIAVPPLVNRYPARRMRTTAAFIDIGFFGAVTAGPLLGGPAAAAGHWRWFLGGVALVGAANLALGLVVLQHTEPMNPGFPMDRSALSLALVATVLPFLATSWVDPTPFSSPLFIVPLTVGLTALVVLLFSQYHKREPLSPVRTMSNTIPVAGTIVAAVAGGAFVSFLELGQQYLLTTVHESPTHVGLLYWPMVLGTIVASVALAMLLRTRFLPHLVLAGMTCIAAGGAVLFAGRGGGDIVILISAALLGTGAGATVSPALWMAAFALPAMMVGRTFALVELVRSVADFVLAPVILAIAVTIGTAGSRWVGVATALWVTLGVTIGGLGVVVGLYLVGRPPSRAPDLESWLEGESPALASPRIGAVVRDDAA